MNVSNNALHEHAASREPSPGQQAASDELRVARERLNAEVEGAFTTFKRMLFVERKALGLAVFDSAYMAACYGALALTGLMTMLVATWLLLASVRRGLQIWTDGAWWSDLVLGAVLIGILAGIAHGARRYVHRSTLAKTRRALSESDLAKSSPAPGPVA